MNLWLMHFGGLLVGTGLLWILPSAASLAAPTGPTTLEERYRRSSTFSGSRDYLVALVAESGLRFWGGPPGSPHPLVEIDATGQACVHREGHPAIFLRLHCRSGGRKVSAVYLSPGPPPSTR